MAAPPQDPTDAACFVDVTEFPLEPGWQPPERCLQALEQLVPEYVGKVAQLGRMLDAFALQVESR